MSRGEEFELEEPGAASENEPVPESAPIVVVQYRNRGIPTAFVPPVLLVLIAAAIVSYRRTTPLRLMIPPPRSSATQAAKLPVGPQPKKAEPTGRVISYEPIVIRDDGLPGPSSTANASGEQPSADLAAKNATAIRSAESVAKTPPPARPGDPLPRQERSETRAEAISAPAHAREHEGAKSGQVAIQPLAPAHSETEKQDDPVALVGGERPAVEPGPASPPPLEEPPSLDPQRPLPRAHQNATAIGFVPPSEEDPRKPDGPPTPISKEEFEEQVRREAAKKEAELDAMDEATPRTRFEQLVETIKKTHADRTPFHNELHDILRGRGQKTGPLIAQLCDQYGRNVHPSVRAYVTTVALIKVPLRCTVQDRVQIMRAYGMPEPMILDYLANDLEKRTRSARNAPRTQDEVRILAARQLLTMTLTKPNDAQIDRCAQAIVKFIVSPPAPSPRRARRP